MKPLALVAFLGCVSNAAASAVLDDARTAEDSFVIDVPHKEHRRLQRRVGGVILQSSRCRGRGVTLHRFGGKPIILICRGGHHGSMG